MHDERTVTSADGTPIAYAQAGEGPPLILLGGAFNTRETTASLAAALADRLRTLNPDRRGRGASGDTAPYAVDREIEDLDALIGAAGGTAAVFGFSSGAVLALRAAARGSAITQLILYDAPFAVGAEDPRLPADLPAALERLVAAGDRGGAVELYQRVAVGMPEPLIERLRTAPFRPALEVVAHTLAYDARVVGDLGLPPDLAAVRTPALVLAGEQSPPIMRRAAAALAEALPQARGHTVAGQGHDLALPALRPLLLDALLTGR